MGGKKKYIEMFGSFTEPFKRILLFEWLRERTEYVPQLWNRENHP